MRNSGHGGAIFYNVANGGLILDTCLFNNCSCIEIGDCSGAICVLDCGLCNFSAVCYYKCFADRNPSYRVWSYHYQALVTSLTRMSEVKCRTNFHSSPSGGLTYHLISHCNSSQNYIPGYFGGIGFHKCPNGLIGMFCQVADSYTEGLVSFYSDNSSLELSKWNFINNYVPSGNWICLHNMNPHIVLKYFVFVDNNANQSVIQMPGVSHTVQFISCYFDIPYSSEYFQGCSLSSSQFDKKGVFHIIQIHYTESCGLSIYRTMEHFKKDRPIRCLLLNSMVFVLLI